jgi:hypothetical protein
MFNLGRMLEFSVELIISLPSGRTQTHTHTHTHTHISTRYWGRAESKLDRLMTQKALHSWGEKREKRLKILSAVPQMHSVSILP